MNFYSKLGVYEKWTIVHSANSLWTFDTWLSHWARRSGEIQSDFKSFRLIVFACLVANALSFGVESFSDRKFLYRYLIFYQKIKFKSGVQVVLNIVHLYSKNYWFIIIFFKNLIIKLCFLFNKKFLLIISY